MERVPLSVRYQENRELTKLRYVLRRERRANPTTWWQKVLRGYIYPILEPTLTVLCLWLPMIYKERHRKLSYAVLEPDTWPYMFTEAEARERASDAWKSYINSLVDEWTSGNVITALILGAAVGFLAVPNINNVSRYCLVVTLLSSLVSVAHATYHSHFYRSLLDNRNYSMLQLRCYISCYRPINGFFLAMPLLNLFIAIGAFSIATMAFLWPYQAPASSDGSDANSSGGSPWHPPLAAKIIIPFIHGVQISLIAASYKWNRSQFFTTNELLVGEHGRRDKALELEKERGRRSGEKILADQLIADNIPVVSLSSKSTKNISGSVFLPVSVSPSFPHVPPPVSLQSNIASTSFLQMAPDPIAFPAAHTGYLAPPNPVRLRPGKRRPLWVQGTMGGIPDDPIPLGYEDPKDPAQLYVAVIHYKAQWLVGSIGGHSLATFPFKDQEVSSMLDYSVLCGDASDFQWLKVEAEENFQASATLSDEFELAWVARNDAQQGGERVYVAAAIFRGGRRIGEVLDGDFEARIPFARSVARVKSFYVLMVNKGALNNPNM